MTPLTTLSATELARRIRAGEVTSREVVRAHLDLMDRVNPTVNAVIAFRAEQALEEADEADRRVAEAADPAALPPLLGVPCTIKESICVEGLSNSCGVVSRKETLATDTAPAAQRLLDAGAILIGLTNLSELTMWVESENRLHGRTRNPYDPARIAGGSSGGEGAAVGSGLSPIGLGSDVGGSIRIPAFCCGVFGHKPSFGLVPLSGMWPPAQGETLRLLVNGPFARRAEDLPVVLRVIAGPDGVDPVCTEMEIGDPASVELDGLRVVIADDAFIGRISGELLAAREQAAGALAAAGARIERVSLRSARSIVEPYLATLSDGGEANAAELLIGAGSDPLGPRSMVARGGPHTVATRLLIAGERLSARTPERRVRKAIEAGRAFAAEVAGIIGDGVMLHPPMPGVAPRHGRTVGRVWWIHPMATFNLAAVPVTQVPLGLGRAGVPLGVQVAAGPGRDHVSMAVACELERVFGGWVAPWSVEAVAA